MIRRLFTVASALSLVMCVATITLWVVSYHRQISFLCWKQPKDAAVVVGLGCLWFDFSPADKLDQFDPISGTAPSSAGHLWFIEPIDDVEGGKLPHAYVDLWPGAPSWAQRRKAVTTNQVIWALKTPHQWRGFGYGKQTNPSLFPGFDVDYQLKVSLWAFVLAFAAPPITKAIELRRKLRRKAAGLCISCGYDLRASIDRCPECGTPIRARAEVTA